MPSPRRLRVLFLVMLAAVITTLFVTSAMRQSASPDVRSVQDFYHKTVNAMGPSSAGDGGKTRMDSDGDGDIDEDDEVLAKQMADRLRAAEQQAKSLANAKAPNRPDPPSEVIGVGSSAGGGQNKLAAAEADNGEAAKAAAAPPQTQEERDVDATLNEALKKSPVVIFSKTYCPYSKRAKGILLEKYQITPEPHVVELDSHPLGPKIQDRLMETTGRRTVPNIMINGVSIGGADDVTALDAQDLLVDKVKTLGGKRVEMHLRFQEDGANAS